MADGPTQPPPEKPILSQEELAQLVDSSVVTIETEDADGEESQGSGFVVDSSGLIATNYHVIEGSRKATVIFRDGTRVGVAGFVAYAPAKDLALLRIPAGGTPLQPLVLADSVPKKGEPVYAVGASFGFSNTLSDGMVSEYRSGREVSAALRKFGDLDIYRDYLGYDLDAQWVQTTAPVSPGNSGGPLVDQRGQVIGINTWVHPEGQNLNFAISAQHIKQLVATAGTTPRPLAQLPPPRSGRGTPVTGDGEKTLAAWTAVANLAEQRDAKLATSQSSLLRIQPMDPHNPLRGLRSRLSRQEKLRRDMSGAYKDYAQGLKSLDEKDVDLGVILLKFAEADLAERLSDVYEELANMAASWVPGQPIPDMNEKLGTVRIAIKDTEADLRTLRDLVRVALNEKYELTFPPF